MPSYDDTWMLPLMTLVADSPIMLLPRWRGGAAQPMAAH
jgi:hypothetical protein